MITEIDASLLEKIADLTGKPVGAFNIRKDMGCEARQSTEHIAIDPVPTASPVSTSTSKRVPRERPATSPSSSARRA